jgi:hypothetical protein
MELAEGVEPSRPSDYKARLALSIGRYSVSAVSWNEQLYALSFSGEHWSVML